MNIQSEWLLPIEGLLVPLGSLEGMTPTQLAENEAVQLFVPYARRLCPDFVLADRQHGVFVLDSRERRAKSV